jgi:hypothetical protein
MVDHRSGDQILASHRACSAAMAGVNTSLLDRLTRARQFRANAATEVSHRNTSLLQRDRVHPDDGRHFDISHKKAPKAHKDMLDSD